MKSEYSKQYEMFSNNMSSKVSSLQDRFNLLKNSMANLVHNLPDDEKDIFILKYNQMSDAFESMFNRYNRVKR